MIINEKNSHLGGKYRRNSNKVQQLCKTKVKSLQSRHLKIINSWRLCFLKTIYKWEQQLLLQKIFENSKWNC